MVRSSALCGVGDGIELGRRIIKRDNPSFSCRDEPPATVPILPRHLHLNATSNTLNPIFNYKSYVVVSHNQPFKAHMRLK